MSPLHQTLEQYLRIRRAIGFPALTVVGPQSY
jgi:hypothetical protein